MSAISSEQKLMLQINQDLIEPSRDPLSNSLYLLFLLENRADSPEVSQLIEWANSWVDRILVQKESSRYVDRDFTSALVCRWALQKANKLTVNVSRESLEKDFQEFVDVNRLFNNFGFTALISTSLFEDFRSNEQFAKVTEWVNNAIREKSIFNDSKNIVFSCLFLEATNNESSLKELANYAAWAVEQPTVSLYDKLYLAWTIWKMRAKITRIAIEKIRIITQETLSNLTALFREPYIDQNVEDVYGAPNAYRPSKIALAVYFDLQRAFQENTITISKEEMARVGVLARASGTLGIFAILFSTIIGYYSYELDWLRVGELSLSLSGLERIIVNLFVVAPMFFLATSGASLFYDGFIRSVTIDQLVLVNLKKRLSKYLRAIIGLIAGSVITLVIVGR